MAKGLISKYSEKNIQHEPSQLRASSSGLSNMHTYFSVQASL